MVLVMINFMEGSSGVIPYGGLKPLGDEILILRLRKFSLGQLHKISSTAIQQDIGLGLKESCISTPSLNTTQKRFKLRWSTEVALS